MDQGTVIRDPSDPSKIVTHFVDFDPLTHNSLHAQTLSRR